MLLNLPCLLHLVISYISQKAFQQPLKNMPEFGGSGCDWRAW